MVAINNRPKLHITQDDYGFWMLSVEHPDGSLQLLSYQFSAPDHLVEDARHLIDRGVYPGAIVLQDEPRSEVPQLDLTIESDSELAEYQVPAPKKAGE